LEKWRLIFSKRGAKDWKTILQSEHKDKVMGLLYLLETDPFTSPPPFKQLQGDLEGAYSRRINHQHRLIYLVDKEQRIIKIVMMWLHYE
jgi:toxin YoeB